MVKFNKEFAPYVREIEIGQIGEIITSHPGHPDIMILMHSYAFIYLYINLFATYPLLEQGDFQ